MAPLEFTAASPPLYGKNLDINIISTVVIPEESAWRKYYDKVQSEQAELFQQIDATLMTQFPDIVPETDSPATGSDPSSSNDVEEAPAVEHNQQQASTAADWDRDRSDVLR